MSIIGQNFDYLFKMVVIGGTCPFYCLDSGVGKTNLLSRFQKNQFTHQSKATIGVEFATKTINLENSKIKTQIWDTAGQERYRAITHAYYKGASGALIVFDLTRRNTFENLPKWLKELRENTEQELVCILIGNKSDRQEQRAIKLQQIVEFAHQNKLFYLETSAYKGSNVESAFMTVIKEIFDKIKTKKPAIQTIRSNNIVVKKVIEANTGRNKKKCCQ